MLLRRLYSRLMRHCNDSWSRISLFVPNDGFSEQDFSEQERRCAFASRDFQSGSSSGDDLSCAKCNRGKCNMRKHS